MAPGAEERLERYREMRSFDRTPEPSGEGAVGDGSEPLFVVQKHDARALHYDFRLEADGVLISWAVPKGPSYDPKTKRLAVHVEDHPLDYRTFEGVIPEAQYGSGTVIVWDEGTYRNLSSKPVPDAVEAGHLSIWMEGTKLHGGWSLTRTGRRGEKEQWLLVKRSDEHADPDRDIAVEAPDSVTSGRTMAEVEHDPDADEWTRERATWTPPMLAVLSTVDDHLRRRGEERWWYERKLDGLRCLAVRNGDRVELWSRNHLSFNERFPDLVEALGRVRADTFTVDGEIAALDGTKDSFAGLHRPGGSTRRVFAAFDLLELFGRDVTGLDVEARRQLLVQLFEDADDSINVVAGTEGDPGPMLEQACADGWEGLVAKRLAAPYSSGRSTDWTKLVCTAGQELIIVGWTDPTGSRTGFGSLLTGYYDNDGSLRYAGKVGTGFDRDDLEHLSSTLADLGTETTPLVDKVPGVRSVHWVRPTLVANIAFKEWTGNGHLRHPSFKGLRPDKDAADVRRE